MLLNYWSSSDEGSGNGLEELGLGIDATRAPPPSTLVTSSFPNVYHMLARSDSVETIRASTRRLSPPPAPRPRHAELPSWAGPSSPKPKNSEPKTSKSKNRVPAPVFVPITPWTFSPPQWSLEDEMIKLSDNIHDGCSDLNPAFDYRYISKEDITRHLTYQRIKLELLVSASQMAREDLERAPGANANANLNLNEVSRAPLLIRHVRSLRDLPYLHAHGDNRELCVAFLTMVARKRGIGTFSLNQLGQNQTEVYRQIASQLEDDMRREYEQVYEDTKRRARRFR